MKNPVEEYLESNGPSLSTDIAAYLIELGSSPTAARKRVSRASGEVKRLNLDFPRRSRFLYLHQQFASPRYWSNLIDAFIESRSAYGYAIAALRQKQGIVPARQFAIICGAPMRLRRHLSPETITARLVGLGLLRELVVPGVGPCLALASHAEIDEHLGAELMARDFAEELLITAVKDWLRKLGVGSYDKVATRIDGAIPQVGTFGWDISAPSYLAPMIRKSGDTIAPGFVVCDVHLGTVNEAGALPFLRKAVTIANLGKVGRCLYILVADRFDNEALRRLKANGVMAATATNLFGADVADALRQLTSTLIQAARSAIDPEKFDQLFRALGRFEGATNQLRGALFEYIVADLARKKIGTQVSMNRMFKVAGKGEAEGDVVAVHEGHSITVIECKGYNPLSRIPDEEFEHWLQHRVPLIVDAVRAHPDWKHLSIQMEFWTTAPLTEKSTALYEKAKAKIRPTRYSIAVRHGAEILQMCKDSKDKNLKKAFRNHFVRYGPDESG